LREDPTLNILATVGTIVSKSSFFIFVLWIAFLGATAASLQSGRGWSGNVRSDIGYEARADVASLEEAAHQIQAQAESAPNQFRVLWDDASRDLRKLADDLRIEVRMAARRISSLIRNT
jgi:hypothetical protein